MLYGEAMPWGRSAMKRWFILFVKTDAEQLCVDYLKKHLDMERYQPFILTKEATFWDKGKATLFKKLLFSSYVIVQTSCTTAEVIADVQPIIERYSGVFYRILSYDSDKKESINIMLRKSEQTMWESLVDSDFCIAASYGVMEGEEVKVVDGPLIGKEGWIREFRRYKQKAFLNVEFGSEMLEISVVLKVLKRASNSSS